MSREFMCFISCVLVLALAGASAGQAADPDLVGWWKLDEGAGRTVSDSSGMGNHGALAGDSHWVPGYSGAAVRFDGFGDYINCGADHSMNIGTGDASLCAWIRFTQWSPGVSGGNYLGAIVSKGALGQLGGYVLVARNDAVAFQTRGGTAPESNVQTVSDVSVDDGNWHFVTGVFKRDEADGVRLYVNGVLQSAPGDASVLKGVNFDNAHRFMIGTRANGNTLAWDYRGDVGEVRLYRRALTQAEISAIMSETTGPAGNPGPAHGATNVARAAVLSWMAGVSAVAHDVYLGTVLEDVTEASRANPLNVLASQNQAATTYTPAGVFEYSRTYYWRIDDVKADGAIQKGKVWEFTVEPIAYPIATANIFATASSSNKESEGPENTVNRSGLDANDCHSIDSTDAWLSNEAGPQPTWIQYEFDRLYRLHEMHVWNYNTSAEPVVGFGIKEAVIEYAVDGNDWSTLGTTHQFERGPGDAGYAHNTVIDLGGVAARYVRITANSNWKGLFQQYGLSEVRFLYRPVRARYPSPSSGATAVAADTTLSWRTGREAIEHDVYLSSDQQAVIDGTAPAMTLTGPGSYTPALDLAGTYYWRVDEVNDLDTPSIWQGDVWSFSTQNYIVVDDFQGYTNDSPKRVFQTWIDGLGFSADAFFPNSNPGNGTGAIVGNDPELGDIMHRVLGPSGGWQQSMPLDYDNSASPYSETTRTFAGPQDWTRHGIKALTLAFCGDSANAAQQMYVKINDAKVLYDGDPENLKRKQWQMWYIDLTPLNVAGVATLSIGFDRLAGTGGQGRVLIDDIRLYAYDRRLVTPVNPGTNGLQVHYQFEGNANDSSGKGRHGAAAGDPAYTDGKAGMAISLDGFNDFVTVSGYKGILADAAGVQQPFTIAAWVQTTVGGDRTIASWGTNSNQVRIDFRLAAGVLRVENGGGNLVGKTAVNDGEWRHVALTVAQGATISYSDVHLWLDGRDDTPAGATLAAFSIMAGVDMAIGYRATAAARYFLGAIDEFHLYDRVLSQEEIAWLAGKTMPFDEMF